MSQMMQLQTLEQHILHQRLVVVRQRPACKPTKLASSDLNDFKLLPNCISQQIREYVS